MRRPWSFVIIGAVTALLAAAFSSCRQAPQSSVIAFAFPQWGRVNVDVAREELAEQGLGEPGISLVYDTGLQADTAEVEVERAIRMTAMPGLVGVVGHGGSRGSLVAAPVYNEAGVVQIVPTGTSSALAGAGPWTFMLAPSNGEIAAAMADLAAGRLAARSAAICYAADEYGFDLADALRRECLRRSLTILDETPFSRSSDLAGLAQLSLRAGRPDVVFIIGQDREAGPAVRAYAEAAPGVRFVAGDGVEFKSGFLRAAGAAADSVYAVSFWHPDVDDARSRAFVERFERHWGRRPSSAEAMRHDAILLLAAAVDEAGRDRDAIRAWLRRLGRDLLPAPGVTGPLSFGPERRRPLYWVRAASDGPQLLSPARSSVEP